MQRYRLSRRIITCFSIWLTLGLIWPTVGGVSAAVLIGLAGLYGLWRLTAAARQAGRS